MSCASQHLVGSKFDAHLCRNAVTPLLDNSQCTVFALTGPRKGLASGDVGMMRPNTALGSGLAGCVGPVVRTHLLTSTYTVWGVAAYLMRFLKTDCTSLS